MSAEHKAVFLSYAREDSEAARCIADALRAAGVEVWFDQSELRGGDAWDANIRQQIKECALFLALISTHTQARTEGYFRREWKLAVERTHDIADDTAFLIPVVIDDTTEAAARVPQKFREVQWTRLRPGANTAAFCGRLSNLLSGERGPRLPSAAPEMPRPGAAAVPAKTRRWLVAGIAGAVSVAALALWISGVFNSKPQTQNSKSTAATPPLSEARKLAAKADALFDQDDHVMRETLAAAEQFCQQALALDPNDAEVWAIYSRVASMYISYTYDRSQPRKAQAGEAAARAGQLAPDSYTARYALAHFYKLDDATYLEAERILRQLLVERPDDKRAWRALGQTLRQATIFPGNPRGRDEEAIECFKRATALPGGDPLALTSMAAALANLGRLDEAERAADEASALKPRGNAPVVKANILLRYRGDVARAREALGKVPVERLREDFAAFIAAQLWWCAREPEQVIAALRVLPRDYLEAVLDGPKGLLIGLAHRMGQRPQAAEIEWRAALQVVERRLAAEPNNVRLLIWKSWLLALLKDSAASKRLFDSAEQLGFSARDAYWAAAVAVENGERDKALSLLTMALTAPTVTTRAFARINPTWDRLRDDPRFEALVADPAPQAAEVRGQKSEVSLSAGQKSSSIARPSLDFATAKSIAVLPFANMSPNAENAFFADGVHEDVIASLAKIHDLKVISRTSVLAYRDTAQRNFRKIAEELGVGAVLEGSVRRAGNKVRVVAKLINTGNQETLWGETYDRDLTDVFAIQSALAQEITGALKATLTSGERALIARKPTENAAAYELYLRAQIQDASLAPRAGRADFAQSESLYREVIALDPNFAAAHARLSVIHGMMYFISPIDPTPERRGRALAALQSAERLAPGAPETAMARGAFAYFCEEDWTKALLHFAASESALPNDAPLLTRMGFAHLRLGNVAEGLRYAQRAVAINPRDMYAEGVHLGALRRLRRYAEVLDAARRYDILNLNNKRIQEVLVRAEFDLDGDRETYVRRFGSLAPVDNDPFGLVRAYEHALLRGDFAAAAGILNDSRLLNVPTTDVGMDDPVELHRAFVAYLAEDQINAQRFSAEALNIYRSRAWTPHEKLYVGLGIARARAYAGQDDSAAAAAATTLREVTARDATAAISISREVARIYVIVGKREDALAAMRVHVILGGASPNELRHDIILSRLKSDPRFEEILKAAKPL